MVAVAMALVLTPGVASGADLPDNISWTATVNGVNVDRTNREAVRLEPGERAQVAVVVQNRGNEPLSIPYVRLEGSVLGLSFYVFTTRVDFEVPAGAKAERLEYEIDLLDLGDQARGLIPSRVVLLDEDGNDLAAQAFRVDVRGDLTSVYMVFGLAVGALTLLLLGAALWRLSTGRLHPNRWRRGLTMAAPGLGLGFVLTFSLSVLRIASPQGRLWAILLLVGAAVGFAAGYLSPNPDASDERYGGYEDADEIPEDSGNFVVDQGGQRLPTQRESEARAGNRTWPLSGR
ncbi:hypothetical protein [Blastococcus sp. CT_GayMR19]|uniref:hypothetical protein n=1 Tax=Blastococcus sp. CT_GayMR19 TaxID=2559608 RepID=UPI00107358E7|nr:hypothetical protein [Blastococcus sp. CT_GayMR19]